MKKENKVFGILDQSVTVNAIEICKNNQLVDISEDPCIPPLLCDFIPPGVILLNDFNANLNKELLKGTFLIKFHNITIEINNKIYKNLEAPQMQIAASVGQQTPAENEFVNLLSLEMLNQLHINNPKSINLLKSDSVVTKYTAFFLFTLLTICLVLVKIFIKEKVIIHNATPSLEEAQNMNFESKIHEPRPMQIDNLPYF